MVTHDPCYTHRATRAIHLFDGHGVKRDIAEA
jgi:hypothetical protein